jgi:hypothetical protein
VTSTSRGYDDIAFLNGAMDLTYTNPVSPKDYIIQRMASMGPIIRMANILLDGAKGVNIATGQQDHTIPATDPDSLKTTPDGQLIQTEGSPATFVFVKNPGASDQSVSFLNLVDSTGTAVSSLDDPVYATATSRTFYLSDTGNNASLRFKRPTLRSTPCTPQSGA